MPKRKQFYDCGICGAYHPANWDGDCRDDANRFAPDQLDAKYGEDGWEEVPMPTWTSPSPQRFVPGGVTVHEYRLVAVKDIKPGDMIDLEGDQFADPKSERVEFDCELATVAEVMPETPSCIALGIEGVDVFGFPPEHLLRVHGHDAGYDDE